MRKAASQLTIVIAALSLAGASLVATDLPKPIGAVNDFADVLTAAQEQALTDLVEGVEDATTAEIAVATVTTLDGMTVEEYANRLFAEWGIGQRDQDNGVLILVAPGEREMRIEVGYGLEEILPDGLAGQIVQETFLPRFRSGRLRSRHRRGHQPRGRHRPAEPAVDGRAARGAGSDDVTVEPRPPD